MTKLWGKVDPKGREVLRQLDQVQRNAREHGRKPLPEKVTKKMINKVVKTVNIEKEK